MTNEFKTINGIRPHLTYPVLLTLFFLGSTLLYNPFDIKGYYSFGSFSSGFHLVMLSSIILVCSLLTRTALHFLLQVRTLKKMQYELWCVCEMALMSAMTGLYTVLFKDATEGYFEVLPFCFKFIFLTLCYPYVFLILMEKLNARDEELEGKSAPADNSLVRFYDEHKRLKLSIAPSSILYVSSEYNYVRIHYMDAGKVKEYMLRASMKSLEAIGSRSLVRCQRSYFVNPEHVTVLRKDTEGFIYAEMNIPDVPAVPVSKQYYEALANML